MGKIINHLEKKLLWSPKHESTEILNQFQRSKLDFLHDKESRYIVWKEGRNETMIRNWRRDFAKRAKPNQLSSNYNGEMKIEF